MSLLLAAGGVAPIAYTLTCNAGSYTYTGQAATLTVARKLSLAAGAYLYTGQAATLTVSRNISLAAGAYTYTGIAASLTVARNLALPAGAYAYAGNDATLTYVPGAGAVNYTLACDAGAYAYSGQNATLTYQPGALPIIEIDSHDGFDRKFRKKQQDEELSQTIRDAIYGPAVADPVIAVPEAARELAKLLDDDEEDAMAILLLA